MNTKGKVEHLFKFRQPISNLPCLSEIPKSLAGSSYENSVNPQMVDEGVPQGSLLAPLLLTLILRNISL